MRLLPAMPDVANAELRALLAERGLLPIPR